MRNVPGHNWGRVCARLGISEHKSNIYLTFLSLTIGKKASSSAVKFSGPMLRSVAAGASSCRFEKVFVVRGCWRKCGGRQEHPEVGKGAGHGSM